MKFKYYESVGWKREVPEPYKACAGDENPASLEKERIEQEENLKDDGELRIFGLFAGVIEDLYTGILENYVKKTQLLRKNLQ